MARSDFLRRALSTGVLWCLILAVVIFNLHWLMGLVLPVIGGAALWEFFSALEKKGIRSFKLTATVGGVFYLLGNWLILSKTWAFMDAWLFDYVSLIFFLLVNLAREVFDRTYTTPIITLAVTLLGILYIPWLFHFLTRLVYLPDMHEHRTIILLYLLAVTKTTDIAAYLTGQMFGRTKLLPEVSPKKTWEGLIGGVLAAVALSCALVYTMPASLHIIGLEWAAPLGLVMAVVSVIGDLAESVLKRDAAIKDSGNVIPGIGGVLDLIDSILFTAPVLYLFLVWKT